MSNCRPSKRGSTFTLGTTDWLDGFSGSKEDGVFFATSLRDNSVYVLKWKEITGAATESVNSLQS